MRKDPQEMPGMKWADSTNATPLEDFLALREAMRACGEAVTEENAASIMADFRRAREEYFAKKNRITR